MRPSKFTLLIIAVIWLAACQPAAQPGQPTAASSRTVMPILSLDTVTPAPSPTAEITATPEEITLLAVIGDYGQAENSSAFNVAEMIDSWSVDLIVTTGDNNYPDGELATIDENIGQFYHRYIGNYQGEYDRGSETNRFFPSLGNHDWSLGNIDPYLDYFTLPGNERYYDFVEGPLHIFILDSDTREPDGVGSSSDQAAWFQAAIDASTAPWQIVVMHHPPYSSGLHGSTDWMQWPFAEWGADLVLSGHDHLYERLEVNGLIYVTNGLGGHGAVYDFPNVLRESQFRYNAEHGAMRIQATREWILVEFINILGELVDSFRLEAAQAHP